MPAWVKLSSSFREKFLKCRDTHLGGSDSKHLREIEGFLKVNRVCSFVFVCNHAKRNHKNEFIVKKSIHEGCQKYKHNIGCSWGKLFTVSKALQKSMLNDNLVIACKFVNWKSATLPKPFFAYWEEMCSA